MHIQVLLSFSKTIYLTHYCENEILPLFFFFFLFHFKNETFDSFDKLVYCAIKENMCDKITEERRKRTLLSTKGRVNTEGIYNFFNHFERSLLRLSYAISRNKPTLFIFSSWTRWRQEWNRARGSFLLYIFTFFILNFALNCFKVKGNTSFYY